MRYLVLMLVLFGLSACTSLPEKLDTPPEGWSCTPDGACWPTDFVLTKQYRYKWLADTDEVKRVCVKTDSPHPYACILMQHSLHPIIIMPKQFTPAQEACGWNVPDTLRHEEGHGEGVTRHHMINPRTCDVR